jgi:hypothetical protein
VADLCGNNEGIGGWDPGPCILPAGHGPDHTDGRVHWSTDLHQQLLYATRDGQFEPGSSYSPLNFDPFRAAIRAAVELHAPVTYGTWTLCGACSQTEGREVLRFVSAPCPEVQAIARELGIEAGGHG